MNARFFCVLVVFILATSIARAQSFDVAPSVEAVPATTATTQITAPPVEIVTGSGVTTLDIVLILSAGTTFFLPRERKARKKGGLKKYAKRE